MSVFMMEQLRVRLVNRLPQRLEQVADADKYRSAFLIPKDGGPSVYREPASAHSEPG